MASLSIGKAGLLSRTRLGQAFHAWIVAELCSCRQEVNLQQAADEVISLESDPEDEDARPEDTATAELQETRGMTATAELQETGAMPATTELQETRAVTATATAELQETGAVTATTKLQDTRAVTATTELQETRAVTATTELQETRAHTATTELQETRAVTATAGSSAQSDIMKSATGKRCAEMAGLLEAGVPESTSGSSRAAAVNHFFRAHQNIPAANSTVIKGAFDKLTDITSMMNGLAVQTPGEPGTSEGLGSTKPPEAPAASPEPSAVPVYKKPRYLHMACLPELGDFVVCQGRATQILSLRLDTVQHEYSEAGL